MSIDEVMDAAVDYSNASWLDQDKARDALIAAIEQHVADAVAREREECAEACDDVATTQWDEYAASYNSAVFDCTAAIRARAEKGTK